MAMKARAAPSNMEDDGEAIMGIVRLCLLDMGVMIGCIGLRRAPTLIITIMGRVRVFIRPV